VRPPLLRVAISLLASGVYAIAGAGLLIEVPLIPAQLGGQFSTQPLVVVATGHLFAVLVDSVYRPQLSMSASQPEKE
jgi:hypothetical protein